MSRHARAPLRAPRAFESFVHLFKGGRVQRQSLWSRSAERETPLFALKDQEGGPRGKPYQGVSPLFCTLCVCAFMFLMVVTSDCPFDPISLVLAQRNGVEPPKKGAFFLVFTIAGRTLRRQCLSVVNASRDAPFAPGEGEVFGHPAVNAPGSLRRGRTCHPDGLGSCSR